MPIVKQFETGKRLISETNRLMLIMRSLEKFLNVGNIDTARIVATGLLSEYGLRMEDLKPTVSRGLAKWFEKIRIENPELKAFTFFVSDAELNEILRYTKRDNP